MRFFCWLCVLAVIATFAPAQDFPKAEIFGGYSYGSIQVLSNHRNVNGWNGAVTVNINRWFGLTSDFSGLYGGSATESTVFNIPPAPITVTTREMNNLHTFMFGPQFSFNKGKLHPFTRFLLGAARTGETFQLTESGCVGGLGGLCLAVGPSSGAATNVSFAVGGGIDYQIKKNIAWRVQADYLAVSSSSNARVSTGIVLQIGK